MQKHDVISAIFNAKQPLEPVNQKGTGYAPTNIALCKYWGKRDQVINLPVTSSLSIALPDKGAKTTLTQSLDWHDRVFLNGNELPTDSAFVQRLTAYLDLFRAERPVYLHIDIQMNIPVAAGLASSACGFASIVIALNDLCQWQLPRKTLSVLARLGSGSASRSLWSGFVEWHAGNKVDGMDSYAEPLSVKWPNLRVGLLTLSQDQKPISSRQAMQQTIETSVLYNVWPQKVAQDMTLIRQAIQTKDFTLLGQTAESNALSMHATMLGAWPPISYALPETVSAQQQVWSLRNAGVDVYFTQDAGPNLKLLFLKESEKQVKGQFNDIDVVSLFD